jgi:hypothetical protein
VRALRIFGVLLGCEAATAGCHHDSPQWLVVDEPLKFCAAAPYAQPLEWVRATQWELEIPAGDVELPEAVAVSGAEIRGYESTPIELAITIGGAAATPADDLEATVIARAISVIPDDEHDALWLQQAVASPSVSELSLTIALTTKHGEDFRFGSDASVEPTALRFMQLGRVPENDTSGAGPSRPLEACVPEGPTTRTHVTLDRGDVQLDVRVVPDRSGLVPPWVMFVAAELRIDGVEVVQREHASLLASLSSAELRTTSYAVLAPGPLQQAGLGCAVVLTELGAATQRAFIADCELRELAALAIGSVTQEIVP